MTLKNSFIQDLLDKRTYIFGQFFIVSSLVPFFGFPQFDSQPFPVFFAILFLSQICLDDKFFLPRKEVIYSFFFILFGCLFATIIDKTINLMTIRAFAGYLSIFTYYLAFDHYLRYFDFPLKYFQWLILIWILVGLLQLIDPSIVSYFVAYRTSEGRGVPSLSPEPTHFGIFLFFSSWIILVYKNYLLDWTNLIIYILVLASILFLAQSSMTLLYIIMATFFYCIYLFIRKRFIHVFLLLYLLSLILMLSIVFLSPGNRISNFIYTISTNGYLFFLNDESARARLSDIIFPLVGLFKNYFSPGGFISYGKQFYTFFDLFFIPTFQNGKKIMSWTMAMWFELGFFGIMAWFYLLKANLMEASNRNTLETFFLFSLLLSAIPALFPLPILLMVLIKTKHREIAN